MNRYVHHAAHAVAVVGILLLRQPPIGMALIAAGFGASWAGHYLFERNTPAFFDASEQGTSSVAKKLQVALGGLAWSGACLLRLFRLGPLA